RFIHKPYTFNYNGDYATVGTLRIMEIVFSKSATNRLPPPYQTQCVNYPDIGLRSRRDCIIECKKRVFHTMNPGYENYMPSDWDVFEEINSSMLMTKMPILS